MAASNTESAARLGSHAGCQSHLLLRLGQHHAGARGDDRQWRLLPGVQHEQLPSAHARPAAPGHTRVQNVMFNALHDRDIAGLPALLLVS
jgi:hypothetical protein